MYTNLVYKLTFLILLFTTLPVTYATDNFVIPDNLPEGNFKQPRWYIVTSEALTVRNGPDINFQVAGYVYRGDTVMVFARENTIWMKTGPDKYISLKHIKEIDFPPDVKQQISKQTPELQTPTALPKEPLPQIAVNKDEQLAVIGSPEQQDFEKEQNINDPASQLEQIEARKSPPTVSAQPTIQLENSKPNDYRQPLAKVNTRPKQYFKNVIGMLVLILVISFAAYKLLSKSKTDNSKASKETSPKTSHKVVEPINTIPCDQLMTQLTSSAIDQHLPDKRHILELSQPPPEPSIHPSIQAFVDFYQSNSQEMRSRIKNLIEFADCLPSLKQELTMLFKMSSAQLSLLDDFEPVLKNKMTHYLEQHTEMQDFVPLRLLRQLLPQQKLTN